MWSSDCIGTDPTCVVPMTDDRAVTAMLAVLPPAAPAHERARQEAWIVGQPDRHDRMLRG
jgi:hypothetical protein